MLGGARHRPMGLRAHALERPGEGEAVVVDELVITPLAVDPDPRLHGGMREPAEAAEGGRGEKALREEKPAARGESPRPSTAWMRGAMDGPWTANLP